MSAGELQRRIFTRWVNQKLEVGKKPPVEDVVSGFKDGCSLVHLVEILAEKEYTKKMVPTTVRIKQADQVSRAIGFVKDCGVTFKGVPASAENLMDSEELPVMGLIWSIMQSFLKFGDDEDGENLSAEDSLKMWAQNQLLAYPDIEIKSFTKSFHNGIAYAALIHKNRPKLINPADLSPGDALGNLEKVFQAATEYFDFERYLEPADVAKLDAKSAFIFLSEFYYGIAKQRKVDLACRRITKLTQFTIKNDEMRAEYKQKSEELVSLLDKVTVMLNDRTIDNTMAGAKAKIEEFQAYKEDEKLTIIDNFFSLESLYNQLAVRLSEHHRPQYEPGERKSVPEFREALKQLDDTETERQIALVQELNRQIKLQQLNEQHEAKHQKLAEWQTKNEAILNTKEVIETSGQAEYQINRLANYKEECTNMHNTIEKDMVALGAELAAEKYEHAAQVADRETQVATSFTNMDALTTSKEAVLDDDLKRMKVKESVDLVALKHKAKYDQIKAWMGEKEAYLKTEETIESISDAELQISILEMYKADVKDMTDNNVASLKAVGAEILATEYKSDLSEWKYADPDDITNKEGDIDTTLGELKVLEDAKSQILDAALKKELEKERLRLLFATQSGEFDRFVDSKKDAFSSAHFGFNLAEVEAFQAKLDADLAATQETSADKQSHFKQTFAEAESLGVTENVYTTHNLESLAGLASSLEAAQETLKEDYATELAKQRANDALCRKFAELAEPFVKDVEGKKDNVTASTAELEAQLESVKALLAEEADLKGKSDEIEAAQKEVDAAEIKNNPHSHFTAKDTAVLLTQYLKFIARKDKQLQEEIEHKNLRGITQEQHDEIEAQFKQFDKDNSGVLSKNEFKSCLYSLGEDKTSGEITEVMNKHGSAATGIAHDGFREFMIEQLGDTDTLDEILSGWELINRGSDVALDEHMQKSNLEDADITYLHDTAPKKDAGYDYTAWTQDVFAR